jgi:hypothetical protein
MDEQKIAEVRENEALIPNLIESDPCCGDPVRCMPRAHGF